MSERVEKARVLIAKGDGEVPQILGAFPQSTYEIVPPEDYDKWKRDMADYFLGPSHESGYYEFREVVMSIPRGDLEDLFKTVDVRFDLEKP